MMVAHQKRKVAQLPRVRGPNPKCALKNWPGSLLLKPVAVCGDFTKFVSGMCSGCVAVVTAFGRSILLASVVRLHTPNIHTPKNVLTYGSSHLTGKGLGENMGHGAKCDLLGTPKMNRTTEARGRLPCEAGYSDVCKYLYNE